jgi:hypothetical protein
MENQIFTTWLNLMMDSEQALLSPLGTSLWLDGLSKLQNLEAATFFKDPTQLSVAESDSLNMLTSAMKDSVSQDNFSVIAHSCLMKNSAYYQFINQADRGGSIPYHFTNEEMGDFEPWSNTSSLGTAFYTHVEGTTRIPFYTYNHENSHMVLFKDYYANLSLTDAELAELFLLIEWFCICMDLILAYDLLKNQQTAAFKELCRVPTIKDENNVFEEYCHDVKSINAFAACFKDAFFVGTENKRVFDFIPRKTVEMHVQYTHETLIERARKTPSKVSQQESQNLLQQLKSLSLTDLIEKLTGIQYAA